MSKTDELREGGARKVGGGGDAPFVKWGNSYAYVEGVLQAIWEGDYGENAKVHVTDCSDNLEASMGKDDEPSGVLEGDTVNVSLNYSALDGITPGLKGKVVHVAFEGWQKSKRGQEYRVFTVFDLGAPEDGESEPDPEPSARQAGPGAPGAEGPPPDEYDDFGHEADPSPDSDLPF